MSMRDFSSDLRVVMTLDAGGTNFRFAAVSGKTPAVAHTNFPSCPNDLKECIRRLVEGFRRVKDKCPEPPVAISFAFPGPADYPRGIIGDLGNLPCFRGGVPLGAILEDEFEVPVFINNDGDLFAYGEAIGGFLPWVNDLLAKSGSPKRFQNLLGVTIGTGFGGGIVHNGEMFLGDNSIAAELWLSRNKLLPTMNVEESVSIRAVRRVYAELDSQSLFAEALMPVDIHKIATGLGMGDAAAARESFRRLGEAAGDAIANALTLVDGLVVIGGGLSGAAPLFLPAMVAELNGEYVLPEGSRIRRLAAQAFNLEDPDDLKLFLKGGVRQVEVRDYVSIVPRPVRFQMHDPLPRMGVGLSRLGTSEAVAMGAYAFALQMLDRKKTNPVLKTVAS
jgi:glucokinase